MESKRIAKPQLHLNIKYTTKKTSAYCYIGQCTKESKQRYVTYFIHCYICIENDMICTLIHGHIYFDPERYSTEANYKRIPG